MPSFQPCGIKVPTAKLEVTPYGFPKILFTDCLKELQKAIPCSEKAFPSKASLG